MVYKVMRYYVLFLLIFCTPIYADSYRPTQHYTDAHYREILNKLVPYIYNRVALKSLISDPMRATKVDYDKARNNIVSRWLDMCPSDFFRQKIIANIVESHDLYTKRVAMIYVLDGSLQQTEYYRVQELNDRVRIYNIATPSITVVMKSGAHIEYELYYDDILCRVDVCGVKTVSKSVNGTIGSMINSLLGGN